MTMLLSFSLTLPLLHFFFLERPPANAAFNLASLDFCTTFFLDGENRINANPMVTPLHIVPEWYFLFAYCILKSIESKIGGVLALGVRVLLIPALSYLPGLGGMHKVKVFLLIRSFIILTALGGYELGPYFLGLARVASVVYFGAILTL